MNGKVKELQTSVLAMQKSNAYLVSKIDFLEKSITNFSLLQESLQGFPSKKPSLPQFDNRGQFYQPAMQYSPPEPPRSNSKWQTKASENINEALFEILTTKNPEESERQLLAFVRVMKNMQGIASIEATLLDKLLDKLFLLASKFVATDFIVVEYVLRWLELILDRNRLRDVEMAKKLNALLVYLVGNLEDEELKKVALRLSQHPHFAQFYEQQPFGRPLKPAQAPAPFIEPTRNPASSRIV